MKNQILSAITIITLLVITSTVFVKNNNLTCCEEKVCIAKCQECIETCQDEKCISECKACITKCQNK